jgi:hypothetical protein
LAIGREASSITTPGSYRTQEGAWIVSAQQRAGLKIRWDNTGHGMLLSPAGTVES